MFGLSKSVARFYVRFSVSTMDAAHLSNMRLHQSRHVEFSCSWTFQVPHLIGSIWAKLISAESIWEASTTRLHVDLHFLMRHGCFHFCISIPVISYVWPPKKTVELSSEFWRFGREQLGMSSSFPLASLFSCQHHLLYFLPFNLQRHIHWWQYGCFVVLGEKKPWLTPMKLATFLTHLNIIFVCHTPLETDLQLQPRAT